METPAIKRAVNRFAQAATDYAFKRAVNRSAQAEIDRELARSRELMIATIQRAVKP
jgi:hypothetical protein